ncbi:MAG: UbiA family prenyltransferase [Bacteroidota bacterium]|nr:UbiA family prenyltransferase [Bacteroidota bacterium]
MKAYFKLLGWQSLLIVFLLSLIIRVSLILPFYNIYFPMTILPSSDYLLFTFAIVLLMAGLNVICSYFDTKMSDILQQTSSLDNGKKLRMFYVLTIVGLVALGFVSFKYRVWQIVALGLVFVGLSYIYAYKYKRQVLVGNLTLSFLYALLIFMPFLLEFFAFTHYQSEILIKIPVATWLILFKVFVFLALYVFVLTFIRDVTADFANMEQNQKDGFSTFATKYKDKKTTNLLIFSSILFMLINAFYLYATSDYIDIIHIIILIIINICPLIYYVFSLSKVKRMEDLVVLYQLLGMIYISLIFTIHFSQNIFSIDVL